MDSYAELTDQLFVQQSGQSSFCANYGDLDKSFTNTFVCEGLLKVCDLKKYYRDFFTLIRMKFGAVPILFIHFPTKLEHREIFRERHRQIKDAISTVSAAFAPFDVYDVPESLISKPENSEDDFPYHYNADTYQYLKE